MNKVVNINLNGIIITIDEIAYGKLKNYIDGLHKHFSGTEGAAEIISDIETRIAELLQLKISSIYTVIQGHDVEEVIGIMGNPWEMDASEEQQQSSHREDPKFSTANHHQNKKLRRDSRNKILGGVCTGISNYLNIDAVFIRALFLIALFIFGSGVLLYLLLWIAIPQAKPEDMPEFNEGHNKRLFRNEDEKMLGGVCAGAADYFGIDAVWIRLAFLVALFFYGSGILLYIILWAIIPKAVTAAQKLQMKGEPVDVNNIERMIRNTFGNTTKPAQGVLANIVSMFGQLFSFLFKTAGKVFALFLIFIALSVIVACCFALFYEQEKFSMIVSTFTIDHEVLTYAKWGIGCFVTSFILGLIFMSYRLLFGKQIRLRYLGLINTTLFIIGAICISIAGVKYSSLIKSEQQIIERNIIYPTADTLYFDVTPADVDDEVITFQSSRKRKFWRRHRSRKGYKDISIVFQNGSHLPFINSQLVRIKPSLTDSIEVKIRKEARGSEMKEAAKIASAIDYKVRPDGNRLWFDRGILIDREKGYRYQQAEVTLSIPVGTVLIMNERVVDMMHEIDYDMRTGTIYKVTQDGLACVDCDGDKIIYDGNWDDEENDVDIDIDISGSDDDDEKKEQDVKVIIKQQQSKDSIETTVIETRKRAGPVVITKSKKANKSSNE
ncbi:MAG: PspC domain-containing protein [Bacteroidota bacterium]